MRLSTEVSLFTGIFFVKKYKCEKNYDIISIVLSGKKIKNVDLLQGAHLKSLEFDLFGL